MFVVITPGLMGVPSWLCNRLKASGSCVNGAPLRNAPGLRWITAR